MLLPIHDNTGTPSITSIKKSRDGTLRVYGDYGVINKAKFIKFVTSLFPVGCSVANVQTGYWQSGTAHRGGASGIVLMFTFVNPADRKTVIQKMLNISYDQAQSSKVVK